MNHLSRSILVLVLPTLFLQLSAADAISPYTAAARKFAEALLAHGRDHYGTIHTPMFVQMIDLRTLEIPKQRTPADWRAEMAGWKEDTNYMMWGKDRSSVAWAQDSNLLFDVETIRLFYTLSKDTGDPRFATAADEYLRYFLKYCVSRTTGFFAWGEHIAYNVVGDEVLGKRHEIQNSDALWEELWKLDPGAVTREIEAIYRYHIIDKRMMAFDRHANYWNGEPERDEATISLFLGVYVESFAFLYQKTGDPKYNEWARNLTLSFHSKQDPFGVYPDNWTEWQARELPEYLYRALPPLATELYNAYERTHDERWLDDANRLLDGCDHAYRSGRLLITERGFGQSGLVDAALQGYRLTGKADYLDLARRAGTELATREQPRAQMALTLAGSIEGLRQLYEITGEKRWLEAAKKCGDLALASFVHSSGLILGTAVVDRPGYYDAIQGPGALAIALYRLGQEKAEMPPFHPPVRTGDVLPPTLSNWKYLSESANLDSVTVSVRIEDASGIGRALLHYAYGNEIGFVDQNPSVSGAAYTFHIPPPGSSFLGDASFAVEAVDGSPNNNRTFSGWRTIKFASEQQPDDTARYPTLGIALSGVHERPSRARVTNWLPAGIAPPEKGWVSVRRYISWDQPVNADRLTVSYAPEETWRLIESTLCLAFWNGKTWTRVASKVDTMRNTVSAHFEEARTWTLLAEDRVLWRAPNRETGVALADLNGHGSFDVLTTLPWGPGELLSSTGVSLKQFPVDPPFHPIKNSSAPAVAHLTPNGDPMLLIGAPSGYIYAYDRNGRLHWRAEVGGEILGALAVGSLIPGPNLAVAASWNGGVAVLNEAGEKLWEKELPSPSGGTPVLVDLDGDGLLDIVLNTRSKIVALQGSTGKVLWEFSDETSGIVTPSVGAFVPNGKPRIVTGDESGAVFALDEVGKLLWRQERIFGPRELPEAIAQYAPISEVGMADLNSRGERQIIATTKSGETVALSARGERLWRFASYERRVGISLTSGAHMAFADLDGDGKLEIVLSQQDSYLYVLDAAGRQKWCYRGYFWYHTQPAIADLQHTGELDIVFTAPEDDGTYALRTGYWGAPGRAPWPMSRGGLTRANCAPW